MSTITAILDPDPDGTLHVPVPEAWRNQRIRITAELEPVAALLDSNDVPDRIKADRIAESTKGVVPQPGCLKGFWVAADFDEPLEDFRDYME